MRTRILFLFFTGLIIVSCQETATIIKNVNNDERTAQEMDTFFNGLVDSLQMPGLSVAIINGSKIAYHRSFGVSSLETSESLTDKSLFEAASLSKPLFAYFTMKQVEKGLLDLDKPLYEYLAYPDIAHDERYKLITARMVLSHSSGFPNWRQDSLKIDFDPGTSYSYSGEGYKYLAQILAKINSVELNQLDSIFQTEISHQTKAKRLYYKWNEDISKNKATGHINNKPTSNKKDYKDNDFGAAGGLHTDAINYAQFLISIFDNSVISPKLTDEMLREQVKLPDEDINKILMDASGWSLGFGIIPSENEVGYFHGGNNDDFQSWMHFYPNKKYGIVLLSNSDKIQSPDFFKLFFDFMNDGINFDLSKLE